jgi:CubicO group peptidase (beta-lactamase class C family)
VDEAGSLEGTVKNHSWKIANLMAIVMAACSCNAAYGQGTKGDAKTADEVRARQERVENGIEPVELGKGQAAIKLSLTELMKAYKDPGLTVAVIDGYKIAWVKAYGTTELGGSVPVTPRTLFQAGSISKPVAATGMLALVQQGMLSLDEDVNVKLKTWKIPENEFTKEQKVTLRRLASHTAGLTVHGFPGYDVDEKVPTIVQVLNGEKPANTPAIRVDFVPGTQWRYSGGGVTIEQLVMTDVTGKAFPALMKELVLDKEGMTDSSYEQPLPAAWAARTAVGTNASGKSVHGRWHVYPEMAAAGLWTTPTDLAKFVIEIALSKQGKSNKVLTQKTLEEMFTRPPSASNFGIGFGLTANPGEFGHDGADEGFQAMLRMNADTGQGIAIMANSDNGIAVASEYVRSVAKEYGWKYGNEARSGPEGLILIAALKGADAVLTRYDELKNAGDTKKRPEEYVLNMIGYRIFMQANNPEEAVKVFAKNAQEYPDSSNVYDSLGEAYAAAGKKELAIENYEKSLKLDPKNKNAEERLKKLKEQK